MTAARLRNTGRFVRPSKGATTEYTINNLRELMRLLNPAARTPTPIRPAAHAAHAPAAIATPSGTVVSVDALDKILNIDTFNNTVTAQAGVRDLSSRGGALRSMDSNSWAHTTSPDARWVARSLHPAWAPGSANVPRACPAGYSAQNWLRPRASL